MNVTSKISVDLTRQCVGVRVNAVQGDGNTRQVEITLLSGGEPWTPPEGVEAAIAYYQPGCTKGMYNLLADGAPAISITGNVATVILAPQMLAVSGTVQASLVFNDAQLNRLTTFPFSVSVASNPAAGAQKTEDYLRLQWLEDKLDEYVKKITEGLTPGGAVSSVNGKTGAVVLSANDVHALPDTTEIPVVPKKVSAFENDAGYLTEHQDISGKVDKVSGMGLSTHDYDDAAKQKVDAIPENPKYTDTVYDDTAVVESLKQLKDELSDLAPAGAAVGQLFRVAAISEDGKYTMEPVDFPSGGGAVDDVQINGKSIVQDGVANIPYASTNNVGLVKVSQYRGMAILTGGIIVSKKPMDSYIDNRNDGGDVANTFTVTLNTIDYAVKTAMCDGKGAAWTDAERIVALLRMGCTVDDNGFVKWTAQEVAE